MLKNIKKRIFSINSPKAFEQIALELFDFQSEHIPVYKMYLKNLKFKHKPQNITEIPFLPIEFFKTHKVVSSKAQQATIFTSSGTTGMQTSCHYVTDLEIYEEGSRKTFEMFYGNLENLCILALLPGYLERKGSSLVYMADRFIKWSGHPFSNFYLNNLNNLVATIDKLQARKQKILLLGVSFALLDLAEKHKLSLEDAIVMETGGMKGRRKEQTREEIHDFLQEKFGVKTIHSEYGMTELLSQAYSKKNGIFYTPPWMKILIRDTYDPFAYLNNGKSGAINIIDLANVNSCSFIETKDLGKQRDDGGFEVLGRFDYSDIRGCNLLVS